MTGPQTMEGDHSSNEGAAEIRNEGDLARSSEGYLAKENGDLGSCEDEHEGRVAGGMTEKHTGDAQLEPTLEYDKEKRAFVVIGTAADEEKEKNKLLFRKLKEETEKLQMRMAEGSSSSPTTSRCAAPRPPQSVERTRRRAQSVSSLDSPSPTVPPSEVFEQSSGMPKASKPRARAQSGPLMPQERRPGDRAVQSLPEQRKSIFSSSHDASPKSSKADRQKKEAIEARVNALTARKFRNVQGSSSPATKGGPPKGKDAQGSSFLKNLFFRSASTH